MMKLKRGMALVAAFSMMVLPMGPTVGAVSAATLSVKATLRGPAAPVAVLPALGSGRRTLNSAAFLKTGTVLPSLVVAAPVSIPAAPVVSLPAAPEGKASAFAITMAALSAPAVPYDDMSVGETRSAAGSDFADRIGSGEVELLVSASEDSGRVMTEDVYPLSFSIEGVSEEEADAALKRQLENLGVSPNTLDAHNARAIGAVSKINTAVLKVPANRTSALKAALEALGLKVQRGRIFEVPKPQSAEPNARSVGLKEMSAVINAHPLQAALAKVLDEPGTPGARKASVWSRAKAWLGRSLGLAAVNPVLPWAVLDTWVAAVHPYLQGRFTKNVENKPDSEDHGTHTASTVIGVDRWNYAGRSYNIFPSGSASESDILFKLNMAQEDGALGTTNSWGDGSGNPEGAIEKLFIKGAEQGIHHSISAGNSGSRPNTTGGPAIAVYEVDLVINGIVIGKVKRIKAVAASDSDKKTARFSSRGPGSATTAAKPEQYKNYPVKPDESGVGVMLIAALPTGTNVPELGGPGGAMSGTSMSNPGVFGAFLLLTRGILVLLKDYLPAGPESAQTQLAMDLARYVMTQTGEKVAPAVEVGDGFINVGAAFDLAAQILKDNSPRKVVSAMRSFLRHALSPN